MSLPASDNFTRADATTLGANWTDQVVGFRVHSNLADPNGTGDQYTFWNADSFGNDQYSEVTFSTIVAGPSLGVLVRASGTGGSTANYMGYYYHATNTIYVNKVVSNVQSALFNIASVVIASGDVLRLEVSGTTLTVKKNGTSVGTGTDSTLTSGSAGLYGYNAGQDASLWGGGNIGGAKLRRNSSLAGLGSSGPFFSDPLSARSRIFIPSGYEVPRYGRHDHSAHCAR